MVYCENHMIKWNTCRVVWWCDGYKEIHCKTRQLTVYYTVKSLFCSVLLCSTAHTIKQLLSKCDYCILETWKWNTCRVIWQCDGYKEIHCKTRQLTVYYTVKSLFCCVLLCSTAHTIKQLLSKCDYCILEPENETHVESFDGVMGTKKYTAKQGNWQCITLSRACFAVYYFVPQLTPSNNSIQNVTIVF